MPKMIRSLAFYMVGFLCTMLLSSCANKPEELRIGIIPIAESAQLYVGIEKGYFKQEGLEIELLSLSGGAKILEALASGSIEIGFSNVVSLILARASGLKFIAITGGGIEDEDHKIHAIMVKKDSSIKYPQDLEGKTIALNTRKNIDDIFIREYLKVNSVDYRKVKFLEIPFPNMESVLLSGEVDAVAMVEPYVTFASLNGESKVLDYNYVIIEPKVEITAYVVSEKWIEKNQVIADKFVRAFNKATDYALANESEVRIIISKFTKLDKIQAQQITLPSFSKKLTDFELKKMIEKVYEKGWIKEMINASSLIYTKQRKQNAR